MFTFKSVRNIDWPTVLVIGAVAGTAILLNSVFQMRALRSAGLARFKWLAKPDFTNE